MDIALVRLPEVDEQAVITLANDPTARRYLAMEGEYTVADHREWVADKERHWAQSGYGVWGVLVDGHYAGWGGLQSWRGADVELAVVLAPRHWGLGRRLGAHFARVAFDDLHLPSVIVLLPTWRKNRRAILRFGFRYDGEDEFQGERFERYRLLREHAGALRRLPRVGEPQRR